MVVRMLLPLGMTKLIIVFCKVFMECDSQPLLSFVILSHEVQQALVGINSQHRVGEFVGS